MGIGNGDTIIAEPTSCDARGLSSLKVGGRAARRPSVGRAAVTPDVASNSGPVLAKEQGRVPDSRRTQATHLKL